MAGGKMYLVTKGRKQSGRRRKWRRRRRATTFKASIGKSLTFPQQKVVRMRYCDVFKGKSVTGLIVPNVYAANGLYDPDITGTGHQPYGFDQWQTFYNFFMVIGSKITCKFSNQAAGGVDAVPAAVGVYLGADASTYPSWKTFKESGRGQVKVLPVGQDCSRTVVAKYSMKKFFRGQYDPQDQYNSSTANAPQDAVFYCFQQPIDEATSQNSGIICEVTIDYLVLCLDPKDMAGS